MNKNRKKTSPIWNSLSDEDFAILVKRSSSYTEITNYFEMFPKGGNIGTVKRRIKSLGIDSSHIKNGKGSNRGKNLPNKTKIPLEEILNGNNPQYKTGHLKDRLYEAGLKEKICEECGLGEIWNGKPIVHHLDHKNGISTDHSLDNLQILCPNCHSQTDTYAGKKIKFW